MDWQIEYQQTPTRCLRLYRGNGTLLRCWHNQQALSILQQLEVKTLISRWRWCGLKRFKLPKQDVKHLLVLATCCSLNETQFNAL